MRYCTYLLSAFVSICIIACSKRTDQDKGIPISKPAFVSSAIADGAEQVAVGEQTIVITFDQNVILVNPPTIKLNDQPVVQATAAYKELRLTVQLARATSYTLVIPANTVKGPTGLFADALKISFSTRGSTELSITAHLVTKNPTTEARNVYEFLKENYGKKTISGAMANVNWNTNEAEWVYKHTGRYPALNCFDYIHLFASPANWINYENTQVAEDWWSSNGLLAASWHWNVPAQEGSTDYHFYTKDTHFDISKAIISGTYENGIIKADLDRIADHLLLLKEKKIPLIWRPLHEAAGTWFWWGAKGPEPYKKLWVLMFETLQAKGVNNLIWVWTSETNDDEWYPGDEYVDIIGIDLYNKPNATEIAELHDRLRASYPNKILGLSEFGNIAGFTEQWNSGAAWSWLMPWYDYERTADLVGTAFEETSHIHADISYWEKLWANTQVISRNEMPNLK